MAEALENYEDALAKLEPVQAQAGRLAEAHRDAKRRLTAFDDRAWDDGADPLAEAEELQKLREDVRTIGDALAKARGERDRRQAEAKPADREVGAMLKKLRRARRAVDATQDSVDRVTRRLAQALVADGVGYNVPAIWKRLYAARGEALKAKMAYDELAEKYLDHEREHNFDDVYDLAARLEAEAA